MELTSASPEGQEYDTGQATVDTCSPSTESDLWSGRLRRRDVRSKTTEAQSGEL